MKRWAIGAAAVLAAAAAGITYAAVPGVSGVISGCYAAGKGALRVIDAEAGETCGKRETPLSWSQTGPKGDKGDPGPPGPAGPQGPSADFSAGLGLEKLEITAPPPIGDFTQVQISSGYRLPQACPPGSVAVKSGSGAGWVCGSGASAASIAVVGKQDRPIGIDNVTGGTPVSVDLETGSWALTAKGTIENLDEDDAGNCSLLVGAALVDVTSWDLVNTDLIGGVGVTLVGATSLAEPTTVRVSCDSAADGTQADDFKILAIRVGAVG